MSDLETDRIVTGDTFDVLPTLPEASVHAVVTDPPYGLNFMPDVTNGWDDFEPKEYQEWCERWASEVKRVLKPGGHLLAFSGNRTHHRLFTGVEDAGFEIRDTLTWHYGSGFPKASDISKTVDKRKDYGPLQEFRKKLEQRRQDAGITKKEIREHFEVDSRLVTMWMGESDDPQATSPTPEQWKDLRELLHAEDLDAEWQAWRDKVGKPSPDWFDREKVGTKESGIGQAFDGDGWNSETVEVDVTKPATDAAREWDGWKTGLKPATEFIVMARKPFDGATVDSVLEHGTGALNIDACRIEHTEGSEGHWPDEKPPSNCYGNDMTTGQGRNSEGRYPANVVFDETAAAALDREVGELDAGAHPQNQSADRSWRFSGLGENNQSERTETDTGGPSRYFYTSKASRSERTEGGSIDNDHPTVKPLDLAEWLIKLVTREGQVVLDPFAGSGTIPKAAKALNREFVGIEQQPRYADIARVRCGLTPEDPATVRSDDAQQGFEAYTDGGAD